jgi:hypothetical protein
MTTWFRLPRIVRAATIGVGWLGYLGLILHLLPSESAARIALPVGIACVFGSAVTAVADHRIQRKFGSVDRMTEYRRALRAGRLPKGVDVDEWARWLGGSQTANGLAALCGLPFVMFGLFTSLGSESLYRWLAVALFTLFFGTCAIALVRRVAGIKALTSAVNRRRESVNAGTSSTRASTLLMKDSVFEMSLAGRLVSGFVMWFAGAFLVLLIADLGTLIFGAPWIMPLGWAAGVAALMGLAWVALGEDRDLRRNFATYDQYAEYHRTLQTGEMPTDIEPELWRHRLASSRTENLVRVVLAVFFMTVGIASIVADRGVYHWVIASLCQLLALWLLVNWWGARERLRRLAQAVDRQAIRQTWG